MTPHRLIALAATAGTIATRQRLRGARLRLNPMTLRVLLAVAMAALGVLIATPTTADTGCGPGGPPPGAASMPVGDVYGQPATLWISNLGTVGISTAHGSSEAAVPTTSPSPLQAQLIDAQQDGNHQIIVYTGREALLYTVWGCTITTVVDQQGAPFLFDLDHRRGTGDGVGCSDLGNGPHLVGLLQLRDEQGNPLLTVRRTEIDLNGATATIGRSDTVTTSNQDLAGTFDCGGLNLQQYGVGQPPPPQ
jgi:hypothetical protein